MAAWHPIDVLSIQLNAGGVAGFQKHLHTSVPILVKTFLFIGDGSCGGSVAAAYYRARKEVVVVNVVLVDVKPVTKKDL